MKEDRTFAAGSVLGLVVLTMALAGCGGGGDARPSASILTPQEEIARLEASGELPTLERSASLGGVDDNGNGVRDDIERHIEKKYVEPAQLTAAMQTARAFQQMLLVDKSDTAALDAASEAGSRAIVCAKSAFPSAGGAVEHYRMNVDLESMTTNTKARLLAYLAYNKARSGTVSTMPRGETCD